MTLNQLLDMPTASLRTVWHLVKKWQFFHVSLIFDNFLGLDKNRP